MNDRQLLDLAARAAGIEIDKSPYNGGGRDNDGFDIVGNAVLDWHNGERWNPLTDDADALRLAVKLGISIDPRDESVCAITRDNKVFMESGKCGLMVVATRRAVVRAAAAMANIAVTNKDDK